MSIILRFTMLSDENDNFVRDYEVAHDMQLTDLHRFICSDLNYDPQQMASFFTSNHQWDKLHEYTLLDMGAMDDEDAEDQTPASPMEGVAIRDLIHDNHDRLIFMFDFLGDRALYLELMESHKIDATADFPRCVVSEGVAPGQLEPSEDTSGGSIFDDIMEDFNDFEGDDSYDDE